MYLNTSSFKYTSNNSFLSATPTQEKISIIPLEIFQCHVTNLPSSGIDCSLRDPNICVKCGIRGVYLTGENIFTKSTGYFISQTVLIFSIIIALVGALANSLTIIIIRRKRQRNGKYGGFDLVLIWLACVDLICCLSATMACSAHAVYLATLPESSEWLLYWLHISQMILLIGVSMFFHIVMAIGLERYLTIAYPLRSRLWFSRNKTHIQLIVLAIYVVILSLPRYSSIYIGENIYGDQPSGLDVPSLSKFESIYRPTKLQKFWVQNLGSYFDYILHLVDLCVPTLGVLVFNILSAIKVRNINKERLQMSSTQQKEIQAARMFIPVVVIVLFCSVWTLVTFFHTYFTGIFYLEILSCVMLIYVTNATANFFIYFMRGSEFRAEIRYLFNKFDK